MKDSAGPGPDAALPPGAIRPAGRVARIVANPVFQKWAARFPLTRSLVRHEGAAMFDLVAGFCHSQILQAFVRLQIPDILLDHDMTAAALANKTAVPAARLEVLLAGAVALKLLKRRASGHYALTTRGAALAGVPGLAGMIDHHDVLYRDLADPVAFFRGQVDTELAAFWPYVFGARGAADPAVAQTYSQLMSDSQGLVASDTLAVINLRGARHIMDVGGGTGAFLAAVAADYPQLQMTLFDLPAVAQAAQTRFAQAGIADRATIVPGSFRDDPLPQGADVISLVRVLYDHQDATVAALLQSVHAALPVGGRIVISEPMTGGGTPQRAGDAYFALYCMAMQTGCARAPKRIAALLAAAGFSHITRPRSRRPFITSVVTGVKQS